MTKFDRSWAARMLVPGVHGRAAARAALLVFPERHQAGGDAHAAVRALARAVLGEPKQRRTVPYWNPAKATAAPSRVDADGERERPDFRLSNADLAWVNLLPAEPEKVADADVERLAVLWDQAVDDGDIALLRKVFGPVARLHAQREAEAELRAARDESYADGAAPAVTTAAVRVAAELEQADAPDITADEAHARAREWVQTTVAADARRRDERVAKASRTLESLPADVLPAKTPAERRSAAAARHRDDTAALLEAVTA